MKVWRLGLISLIFCLIVMPSALAQQSAIPEVTTAVICTDVIDRSPFNEGTSFSSSVGRLFCFTRIEGVQYQTEVNHVWYFGNKERARVPLSVRSSNWRTFSSKIIQVHEVGQWFVDVEGTDGQVLKTIQFQITP